MPKIDSWCNKFSCALSGGARLPRPLAGSATETAIGPSYISYSTAIAKDLLSDAQGRPHNVYNDASCVVGKTGGEVEKGTEVSKQGGKWKDLRNRIGAEW